MLQEQSSFADIRLGFQGSGRFLMPPLLLTLLTASRPLPQAKFPAVDLRRL